MHRQDGIRSISILFSRPVPRQLEARTSRASERASERDRKVGSAYNNLHRWSKSKTHFGRRVRHQRYCCNTVIVWLHVATKSKNKRNAAFIQLRIQNHRVVSAGKQPNHNHNRTFCFRSWNLCTFTTQLFPRSQPFNVRLGNFCWRK